VRLNHYRTGEGEPLVLIHGIGSRWQMWDPVIDGLRPHREVIALDLPGFGASPMPPPGTPPGLDSLVTAVAGFLGELGVQRPHCAGNSLGGLIALEMGRRGLVRSATAVSPAGFANRPEMLGARASLWLMVRTARWMAPRAQAITARPRARALAFGQVVAHPTRISPRDGADSIRALAEAPWFDATLPAIRPFQFTNAEPIPVPVTIAWGEKDRLLLPRQAARAQRTVPGARMVTLHDCGHVPTYDDPAQVTRVLLEGSAPAYSGPVATGRSGSLTHSLHEPG
jgi:pimeloyl-ACP methyl ester carboxylesterase